MFSHQTYKQCRVFCSRGKSDPPKDTKVKCQARGWNCQVAAGDLKRAVEFSADRHGLLCSWLKTLYVGVTRARKRAARQACFCKSTGMAAPLLKWLVQVGEVMIACCSRGPRQMRMLHNSLSCETLSAKWSHQQWQIA